MPWGRAPVRLGAGWRSRESELQVAHADRAAFHHLQARRAQQLLDVVKGEVAVAMQASEHTGSLPRRYREVDGEHASTRPEDSAHLARANVGRSTFYSHFRDKDELLERSIHEVLRRCESAARETSLPYQSAVAVDRILGCSRALLEHIGEEIQQHPRPKQVAVDVTLAPLDSQRWASVHERAGRILVEFIADELEHGAWWRDCSGDRVVPSELLARHVASTFSLVLRWWLVSGTEHDAATAYALFRALVLPVLARSRKKRAKSRRRLLGASG